MSKINNTRAGCKDVFKSFLVSNCHYAGTLEIPCIKPINAVPNRLIAFSKAIGCKDYDQWVHFYEDDVLFERIWNNPKKYLPILKKFKGVISPDFSIYRDMPLVMQQWNIYRNRAIGHWLQENGIPVICNVRWGDARTYAFFCLGAPRNSIISIGTHGCIKISEEQQLLIKALEIIVANLNPHTIVVYGKAPNTIFDVYRNRGIQIITFESECSLSHKEVA